MGGRDFATRHAARRADARQARANMGARLLETGALARHAAALLLDYNFTALDARGPTDGETGDRRDTRQNAIDHRCGNRGGTGS